MDAMASNAPISNIISYKHTSTLTHTYICNDRSFSVGRLNTRLRGHGVAGRYIVVLSG